MRELRDFATFPHFFSETMRIYRHTSVVYLNTVAGNTEQFIKRNFRVRLITNTVLPGAYDFDLALIENDRFLLTSVDLRRLQQVAESMNFEVDEAQLVERSGVRLPSQLWDYIHQVVDLPLYDRTPYHRGTVIYYLWQLGKYYLWSEKSGAVGLSLAEVARFYLREVRRVFRSNREVNEAFLRLDRGTLEDIAARILIVDIPPVDGYQQLPSFLQVREMLVNEHFSLQDTFPPDYFLGSRFENERAYLDWLRELLEHCQHMQFWLMIVRDVDMLPGLQTMLGGLGRHSRSFSHPIENGIAFTYLLAQEK